MTKLDRAAEELQAGGRHHPPSARIVATTCCQPWWIRRWNPPRLTHTCLPSDKNVQRQHPGMLHHAEVCYTCADNVYCQLSYIA